jgi:hypothetical protein
MRSIIKRVAMVATITALLAVATVHMPPAYSSDFTANDKTTEFLSSVVGLDLTKYTLISPSEESMLNDTSRYPSEFCGLVKEECLSYKFEANESKISTMSIFYNGQMVLFDISSQDSYVYSKSLPSDILNQAKTILQRYQTYVTQVYATDSSYLVPMQNILNSINDLSPANTTNGNVNFQVSTNGDYTRIQWIYTENGVSMKYKTVDLSFLKNNFVSFMDTWHLYSVSGPSVISSEEAFKIALEAAQNYELIIVNEDGETEIAKLPDLSDAFYEMYFTMIPYRNISSYIPSKISRDPLTLYPYWQFYFYFKEKIAGDEGIQVAVWGDTKEIRYCSGFGYFGTSDTTSDKDVTTLLPENQTSEEQQQEQPNLLDPSVLAAVIIIAVIPAVSIPAIALRHRNQRKC